MNIMIFASTPISHIFPLKILIDELISKGNVVYCISRTDRKDLIESYGAYFIEYPFDFERNALNLILGEKMFELEYLWKKGRYNEAMEEFLKYDLRTVNNATTESLQQLEKLILDLKIDLIFRDAVEKHAYILAKKLNIKCIGYITHNLYSKEFFEQNPSYYYRIFLNCLNFKELEDDFFSNYRKYITSLTAKEKVADTDEIMYVLHQFDPSEEYNIIFSTKHLQPNYYNPNRKYKIIYPSLDRFSIEKEIPKKLVEFINISKNNKQKIVYIATGSMMSHNLNYYFNFAKFFVKNNMRVIISLNYKTEVVEDMFREAQIREEIYIDKFLPQKYVLNNSSLFVSTGGQNSILEAIFFNIPMLINPMTSEQRMNGIWLEYLNIARTSYKFMDKHITLGHMINELLNNTDIKNNLLIQSNDLKNTQNDFQDMWKYIYENN